MKKDYKGYFNSCNTQLFIPEAFDECRTYALQIAWLAKQIKTQSDQIKALQDEVNLLKNS